MTSHTTDWFPGRVPKKYKDNYAASFGKEENGEEKESTEEKIPETGESRDR
jgi:hypothetical protein